MDHPDPVLARASVASVMFNYYGFSCTPVFQKVWYATGVSSRSFDGLSEYFKGLAVHGGIVAHGNLDELRKYSAVVDFVLHVRNKFMSDFAAQKVDFAGMQGEAFFIGTVVHSLDHGLMALAMEDPLWLDASHPEVRAGVMPHSCCLRSRNFCRFSCLLSLALWLSMGA